MTAYKRTGRDLMLYITNEDRTSVRPIAACKSFDFQVNTEMTDVSSVFSGSAKEMLPGRYSWSITCNALIYNNDVADFLTACIQKNVMYAGFSIADLSDVHGACYVQFFKANGAVGSLAAYDITLAGTGPLTPAS